MLWIFKHTLSQSKMMTLAAAVFIASLWFACGGTPERDDIALSPAQLSLEETPTPIVAEIIPPTPTLTPTPTPPKQELGLIIRHPSTLNSTDWLGLAANYQATHIQIGGEAINAIEDLIFQQELQNQVRRLFRQAKQSNLRTLVWSSELNLGDGLFRFDQTDPFYAARQSAYRNVLNLLPEIDGVVLQLADAQSPPWNAVADPTVAPPGPVERIRFVIDMVKRVVVDEKNKQLWIRVGDEGSQAIEWIASALQQISDKNLGVILAPNTWLKAEYNRSAWVAQLFEGQSVILEVDASMEAWGGENTIISVSDQLKEFSGYIDNFSFRGFAASIDTQESLVFDSPNRSNLVLFNQIEDNPQNVLIDWIEKEYQFAPVTKEGIALKNLFAKSWGVAKKIATIQGSDAFSFQWDLDTPPSFNNQELNTPSRQLLYTIAQESYDAHYSLEQTIATLQEIQFNLPFVTLSSLDQRVKNQLDLAKLMYYAKQCYFGFQFWKFTRDEQEALYLEGHLKALQQLAINMPQTFSINGERIDAGAVLMFVSNIRSRFPRVLFGAQERDWAKIFNVEVRQIGMTSIEVRWQTSQPTVGSCRLVSTTPPLWEQAGESSFFAETEHQIIIDGLQPGRSYSIFITSTTSDGLMINGKDYVFSLDAEVVF